MNNRNMLVNISLKKLSSLSKNILNMRQINLVIDKQFRIKYNLIYEH